MSKKTVPFGPYDTAEELARGKRRLLVSLLLAVGAAVLGVVALRAVGDDRLVTVYAGAAVIWFVSALGEAVRWSNTTQLEDPVA